MKYSVLKVVNGSHSVVAEGIEDVNRAKTTFHNQCASLWNAPDVKLGSVVIVGDHLDQVDGYHEVITHEEATPAE